ncbi:LOG family protein [Streptomyces sp. AN091965]|uniref:SLOG cluster 4 domain-containing protein n=1 Tax=Streptomyces sp. AN091965 TaxID=2927803 RepID=UPI001F600451|nr:LOG family protein [Streptomyces sp. AN091965]MCI3928820.1 LOG family protein [Streptomyces sp. AN091965]
MTTRGKNGIAVFLGGVVPPSEAEERMAEQVGGLLAAAGLSLLHGGYNGLMEDVARGAAAKGGIIAALTLAGKRAEWGEFNKHVTEATYLKTLGARLDHYFEHADVVVAMGGGVGTLHELAAALYYGGNIRPIPVWITGPTALNLLSFLRQEMWLFESPTRPLDFISEIPTATDFASVLSRFLTGTDGGEA